MRLGHIYEEIDPAARVLKSKEKTIQDYITALYDLEYDGYRKTFGISTLFDGRISSKEYEQIYRIVMEIYDRLSSFLGRRTSNLKEFTDILRPVYGGKVGLIPPGVDEVVVGDTQRTRLKDIWTLFFVGMNEGIVPASGNGWDSFRYGQRTLG